VADFAPAHHCTASETVKDSSVIIAYNAAPALLGGGDGGGISFSKRSQHLDGQLLQVPVTLGRFTTTLRTHLGCCQPRCLNVCLPIPASLSARHCDDLYNLLRPVCPSASDPRFCQDGYHGLTAYGSQGWPAEHSTSTRMTFSRGGRLSGRRRTGMPI
jgi:hypothetical protein